MRRIPWLAVAFVAVVSLAVATPGASAALEDEDYAPLDVRVTDSQGVLTEVLSFGYAAGPNVLLAHRGDADVDVPLRRLRVLEIGEIVERTRRAPCRAVLVSGKAVALEIDNAELTRLLAGSSEIGAFRIRLAKVRRLEILGAAGDARP